MHFIPDEDDPRRILGVLRDALPPGSFLALSHVTGDFRTDAAEQVAAVYDQATSTVTLRSHAQVASFFDGWDLVEPGLVQVPLWRPDGKLPRPRDLGKIWIYGGVAGRAGWLMPRLLAGALPQSGCLAGIARAWLRVTGTPGRRGRSWPGWG